jgi:hypothetical protein
MEHIVRTAVDPQALRLLDRAYEPEFLELLRGLNERVASAREPIEGSLCYWNMTPPEALADALPIDELNHVCKRINFSRAASKASTFLEIGLNAGHSALLALYTNERVHFYAVDICSHTYAAAAADFLKSTFNHRFHFLPGDSREILPMLAIDRPSLKFDALHIDGSHDAGIMYADVSNAIRIAQPDALFIFDDLQAEHLYAVFERFVSLGLFNTPVGDFVNTRLHKVMQYTASPS